MKLFNEIFVKTRTYSYKRHDDDNDADTPVDKPQAAQIETAAYLVDDKCDGEPPNKSAEDNRHVSKYIMAYFHFGQEKVETGE